METVAFGNEEVISMGHSPIDSEQVKGFEVSPTPEELTLEEDTATPVLTDKNTEHQNIAARRNEEGKRMTPPNPVKVPPNKIFGFPWRYRSPTDSIMSPTSKGLLARNRRPIRPIELPAYVAPKAVENTSPR